MPNKPDAATAPTAQIAKPNRPPEDLGADDGDADDGASEVVDEAVGSVTLMRMGSSRDSRRIQFQVKTSRSD